MDQYIEFAGAHPVLTALAALLSAIIVATETKRLMRRWRELSPAELTLLVNDGALLLDLRAGEAHRAGHIPGARLVKMSELDGAVANHAKDAQVVVCCETGADSAKAADQLSAAGFTKVGALRGGLASWRAENLPLVKG